MKLSNSLVGVTDEYYTCAELPIYTEMEPSRDKILETRKGEQPSILERKNSSGANY
jgi:hypothetical protein